jgi:GGDEF domain-containing protein
MGSIGTITPRGRLIDKAGVPEKENLRMPSAPRGRRISYETAQRVVLVTGVVILLGLAALLYFTRVDTIEVWAVLFYLPVFVAFMIGGLTGGSISGVLAAGVYVAIRYPSLDAIQGRDLVSLLLGRALGYVAFGAIGGWASSELGNSIRKLNRFDTIDDDTGLLNARQFVVEAERQMERAQRYGTTFSLAFAEISLDPATPFSRRQTRALLRGLGEIVARNVRQVDAAAHSSDGVVHRFGILLPDTAGEGANIFATRLARGLGERLGSGAAEPTVRVASYGEEPDFVRGVVAGFRADHVRDNGGDDGGAEKGERENAPR